jgi:adenylate cyclase class IV
MPSNVDIKARVEDLDEIRRLAAEVADGPPTLLQQTDTFFKAAKV